jgi:electron transfer flavoprotein alpha subunit
MEAVLFLAHTEPDGSLGKPALEALAAAKAVALALPGAELAAGLVGQQVQAAADAIATSGAVRFLAVAGAEFAQSRYASDAAAIEALCQAARATLVIAPGTSRWNRVAAGAAQRLGGGVDTHVGGIAIRDGMVWVSRWYYRRRLEAVLRRAQRPWFIVVEPGSQAPWDGPGGTAAVQFIPLDLPQSAKRTSVEGIRQPEADTQTIRPDAALLLVAGAGWTKKQADGRLHIQEAEKLILDCLRLTHASLGSSKSLVDLASEGEAVLGFLTHLNQIGQTGATPRHPKGLAACCHGEEPHTVGWRFVNERRAINLDPNCGWARGKADVLYVADAFAVMAKVNELLAAGAEG